MPKLMPQPIRQAMRAKTKPRQLFGPYSAMDQSNKYWTAGKEVTTLDTEQANTEQRVRPSAFL
jgi:hypothetical protein